MTISGVSVATAGPRVADGSGIFVFNRFSGPRQTWKERENIAVPTPPRGWGTRDFTRRRRPSRALATNWYRRRRPDRPESGTRPTARCLSTSASRRRRGRANYYCYYVCDYCYYQLVVPTTTINRTFASLCSFTPFPSLCYPRRDRSKVTSLDV